MAALDRAEPIGAEQRGDVLLELLLLQIEPALTSLDAFHQLVHRDLQRADDGVVQLGDVRGRVGPHQHVAQAALEGAGEQRERLGGQHLLFEEEADDRCAQARQRVLAGAQ